MPNSSRQDFKLEALRPEQYPLVKRFYKLAKYHSHVGKEDEVYVLRDQAANNQLLAAVRLVTSSDSLILRSMVVAPEDQGLGLGSILLHDLQTHLNGRECWCFPFQWLESFYAQIDFQCQESESAPPHIAEKYHRYIKQGRKLSLMKRSGA